jgi:leader peptidase (prepilin peptidase)/N-methyltransferase
VTSTTDALAAILGVLGLVIGSFLNVVIYRVPRGMSLVRPGSSCPSCGTPIRWFDNVPVLSWIALRGRCRRCRRPISLRYPLVELATGVIFAAAVLIFGRN